MRFLLFSVILVMLGAAGVARSETVVAPTVTARNSSYGRILFDGTSHALYAFTRDPRGKATCYGECAGAWPPYIVRGMLRAGAGTTRSLLGVTRRRDGKRQLTYAGRPLYFYARDGRGEVRCQDVREFGGLWLVVRPNGTLVR